MSSFLANWVILFHPYVKIVAFVAFAISTTVFFFLGRKKSGSIIAAISLLIWCIMDIFTDSVRLGNPDTILPDGFIPNVQAAGAVWAFVIATITALAICSFLLHKKCPSSLFIPLTITAACLVSILVFLMLLQIFNQSSTGPNQAAMVMSYFQQLIPAAIWISLIFAYWKSDKKKDEEDTEPQMGRPLESPFRGQQTRK